MRTLSTSFVTEANAQQTGVAFLTLLELSYTGADTLYLVNNYTAITSNGQVYQPFPFEFTMPSDTETRRTASITIDNIDRSIANFVLSATTNDIIITERLVMSTSLDVVESTRTYLLKNAVVTRYTVTGELSYMEYLQDAFPALLKTPSKFPGIF